MEKDTNFTHFISKLLHISVSKLVHICTFATVAVHICTATVDLLSNILIISLSSLSLFLGCVCQFAANSPHTAQPPSNHHHHNTPQYITIHDIPITRSIQNKGKSNQKSIQTQNQWKTQQLKTQNQTFNTKPIKPNPKSNPNPNKAAIVATAMESMLPSENPSQKQPNP